MPLSLDNIIQSNSGNFDGTSGTVSLGVAATAGNMVVVCAVVGGTGFVGGTDLVYTLSMTGFTKETQTIASPARCRPEMFSKKNIGAGESSWTLTVNNSQQVVWYAFELSGVGLDPNADYRVRAPVDSIVTSVESTKSTGTTDESSSYDTLSIALFAGAEASTTVPAFSGYTNGFAELYEAGRDNGSRSIDMAIAYKFKLDVGTEECTASVSPDAYSRATLVTFMGDGSKRAPDIVTFTGFEFGLGTTMANTTIDASPAFSGAVDETVGSPAIVAADRTGAGSYCLELSSSAATESVAWLHTNKSLGYHAAGANLTQVLVERFHVRFPTSLPSADTEIAWIEAGSVANGVKVWFRQASSKIGVQVGSGTEVLSDATVAADKWIGIDLRYDTRNTTHTFDWQVDYDSLDATGPVEQTQAIATGMTVADINRAALGWPSARTTTARYDDWFVSRVWGAYPIGNLRARAILLDSGATPTVSGSSANFKTWTANGTMANYNGATAISAMSEIPPVIGASSTGFAQATAASTDFVEFPFGTFTASPTNVLRAARLVTLLWSDSGNPATIGLNVSDSVLSDFITIDNVTDHGPDNAAALWMCRIIRESGVFKFYNLTQARLDGMLARIGYSSDATPDIGFHLVMLEVAYQPADVFQVSNIENGTFTLDVRQDPTSGAVASLVITTNHASRGVTGTATINGVDYTKHVTAGQPAYEWQIGASSIGEVTAYGLIPD